MSWSELASAERELLLTLARASIEKGLCGGEPAVQARDYAAALRVPGASFVTLHVEDDLRGCIGSLTAREPLVVDVAKNAFGAAFRDPRFPVLTWREFRCLDIHLSLLNAPEPVACRSEEDLLAQLRPGVDGLVIEEDYRRGTFLPAVWEQLPEPREFLRHLKRKAGLPADYWSGSLRVSRYTVESIP
jgi:AmmeMemoRadiSam system protein A